NDADGDFLIITAENLPPFAELFDYGDGTAILSIDPVDENDNGIYPDLQLSVRDNFEGTHTISFSITIGENHTPELGPVSPVTVKETYQATVGVLATDEDNDIITWSTVDAPSFLTTEITDNYIDLVFK